MIGTRTFRSYSIVKVLTFQTLCILFPFTAPASSGRITQLFCECFTFIPITNSQSIRVKKGQIQPFLSVFDPNHKEEAGQWYNAELVNDELDTDGSDGDDDETDDWLPDREKALRRRKFAQEYYAQAPQERVSQIKTTPQDPTSSDTDNDEHGNHKIPVYTEEEEELILAMGGRTGGKREPGFLGDSSLAEIAQDYSIPVCYLADVLCTWGVPVPIRVQDRLGDMVTGEQAFAILEAIHTLDVAALQDRYSNNNIMEVCDYYDIELRDAFQMAIKEGWSVPFGVQTCLRVEQERELLRVLGGSFTAIDTEDD